ncbi:hypothetical protein PV733_36815 [Streptomyces europaeiscabiei]|uniref:hypothetical protein n=1 Tax=Streptomyces europaeiscabiei TaxID=146819 RepID=UPI0029A2F9AE|nr:hypothetical protein [Streptomyces europaeiscabiei]MDX3714394.1 hypothetical protein [Streptomyces europaeiscabiei]
MRDPETSRLLTDVRTAVAAARAGGVAVRACIFDATTAAVDGELREWPSPEARHTAEGACRAVDPPTAKAGPTPPPPPAVARALFWLANRIAARSAS